jgi:hypothetical protein
LIHSKSVNYLPDKNQEPSLKMVIDSQRLFLRAREVVNALDANDPLPVPCLTLIDAASVEEPIDLHEALRQISEAEGKGQDEVRWPASV